MAIHTSREDRRAMFQITGKGRWLYTYPGQRKAIIQVGTRRVRWQSTCPGRRKAIVQAGTRKMTVTIQIPGKEEGDHSSRYPGEDSGNPNTRGQRKAIFDRKMLINIRIPDVTRGEDDLLRQGIVLVSSHVYRAWSPSLDHPPPPHTHRAPSLSTSLLRKFEEVI